MATIPYRYLKDIAIADIAFEARGDTLEQLFIASWDAVLNIMVEDLGSIHHTVHRRLAVDTGSVDMLLFKFLSESVFLKDAYTLVLQVQSLSIKEYSGRYHLESSLWGEPLDPLKHRLSLDVKAITLHRFTLTQDGNGWRATVVVDV